MRWPFCRLPLFPRRLLYVPTVNANHPRTECRFEQLLSRRNNSGALKRLVTADVGVAFFLRNAIVFHERSLFRVNRVTGRLRSRATFVSWRTLVDLQA